MISIHKLAEADLACSFNREAIFFSLHVFKNERFRARDKRGYKLSLNHKTYA